MTDTTEKKALALAKAVAAAGRRMQDYAIMAEENVLRQSIEAHARAIEQHEAFRQEVSDAVEEVTQRQGKLQSLLRFIIAKPDPLVEALAEATGQGNYIDERDAIALRAAMKARGYEWRKIEGEG